MEQPDSKTNRCVDSKEEVGFFMHDSDDRDDRDSCVYEDNIGTFGRLGTSSDGKKITDPER